MYLSYNDFFLASVFSMHHCTFIHVILYFLVIFVQVYDGEDLNAPLLLQHCGSSLPGLLRSTGSSLTLRLKADGQAPSRGFSADYKRVMIYCNTYYILISNFTPNTHSPITLVGKKPHIERQLMGTEMFLSHF